MKLNGVRHCEVVVYVRGAIAAEFADNADSRTKSSVGVKYLEATSGEDFSIYIRGHRSQVVRDKDAVQCSILMDGVVAEGGVFRSFSQDGYCVGVLKGVRTTVEGQHVLRPFQFLSLTTGIFRLTVTL